MSSLLKRHRKNGGRKSNAGVIAIHVGFRNGGAAKEKGGVACKWTLDMSFGKQPCPCDFGVTLRRSSSCGLAVPVLDGGPFFPPAERL